MAVTVLHAQTIGFGKSEILQAPGPHQGVDPVEFTLRFDAELATDPEFQSPEQAIETTVPPAAETTQRPRTSQPLNAGPGNPTPDSSEIPLPNGRPIPVDRQTFPVPIPSEFATDRTAFGQVDSKPVGEVLDAIAEFNPGLRVGNTSHPTGQTEGPAAPPGLPHDRPARPFDHTSTMPGTRVGLSANMTAPGPFLDRLEAGGPHHQNGVDHSRPINPAVPNIPLGKDLIGPVTNAPADRSNSRGEGGFPVRPQIPPAHGPVHGEFHPPNAKDAPSVKGPVLPLRPSATAIENGIPGLSSNPNRNPDGNSSAILLPGLASLDRPGFGTTPRPSPKVSLSETDPEKPLPPNVETARQMVPGQSDHMVPKQIAAESPIVVGVQKIQTAPRIRHSFQVGDAIPFGAPAVSGEAAVFGTDAPPTSKTTGLDSVPVARNLLRQIALVAPSSIQQGAVEIALDPVELGKVRMTLSQTDGAMSMIVVVERQETLDLMRRHSELMEKEFSDLGFDQINLSFTSQHETDSDRPAFGEGPVTEPAEQVELVEIAQQIKVPDQVGDRLDLRL